MSDIPQSQVSRDVTEAVGASNDRDAPTRTLDGRPVTRVAVGVMLDAQGRFLLAQRPDGKPYAGYWEFPGGKLEEDETVETALARELEEELGVRIHGSVPWRVLEHDYPHAYVRLFFHKITRWDGVPTGREGQAFFWAETPVTITPLLPAAEPIIAWLASERRGA
ncbi:NUDIX domain-containing protein [Robbsia andropogonis]|uniref:NUDIX domain-containing protein n=1 Tax=Robbsia andropogonis TaxID=28092 RepID=UPI00209D152D|nr:NUDIX domain-containing protein [Robbsia andropogonis]MCP1118290.1 NUDIX domain-containing protein [Robbsia andropogonis]MCP1127932.1 NUDIX domain-containing protein [Robbsia andropogonis]